MRIVSYNIWMGAKPMKPYHEERLPYVIELLKELQPDILCLQEVVDFDFNQTESLRKKLSMRYYDKASGTQRTRARYDIMILSKFPIINTRFIPGMHHAALQASIETPLGQLSLCTAHLSPDTEDERIEELEKIIDRQKDDKIKIITGDLNFLSPHNGYEQMEDLIKANDYLRNTFTKDDKLAYDCCKKLEQQGYIDAAQSLGLADVKTHPAPPAPHFGDGMEFRIDYFWLSKNLQQRIKRLEVIKNELANKASDHYPIVMELE